MCQQNKVLASANTQVLLNRNRAWNFPVKSSKQLSARSCIFAFRSFFLFLTLWVSECVTGCQPLKKCSYWFRVIVGLTLVAGASLRASRKQGTLSHSASDGLVRRTSYPGQQLTTQEEVTLNRTGHCEFVPELLPGSRPNPGGLSSSAGRRWQLENRLCEVWWSLHEYGCGVVTTGDAGLGRDVQTAAKLRCFARCVGFLWILGARGHRHVWVWHLIPPDYHDDLSVSLFTNNTNIKFICLLDWPLFFFLSLFLLSSRKTYLTYWIFKLWKYLGNLTRSKQMLKRFNG